jgi:hypothetical protein
MTVRRATASAVVVLLAALAAVSWQAGWFGRRITVPKKVSPRRVSEIPSTLPRGGVKVAGVVLRPLTSAPSGSLSAKQAIAKALQFTDRSKHYPVTAIEADMSLPGSSLTIPRRLGTSYTGKSRIPVWVVTLTYPHPEDVGVAAPSFATHQSVAVDAVTGKFVRGFFE